MRLQKSSSLFGTPIYMLTLDPRDGRPPIAAGHVAHARESRSQTAYHLCKLRAQLRFAAEGSILCTLSVTDPSPCF